MTLRRMRAWAVGLVVGALLLAGCTSTTSTGFDFDRASGRSATPRPAPAPTATSTSVVPAQPGAPMADVVAAAGRLGYDCGLTRDEPKLVLWWCYPPTESPTVDYDFFVAASDRVHVARLTVVGSSRPQQTDNPAPEVQRLAVALLPATLPGGDGTNAAQWLSRQPTTEQSAGERFGALWVSWVTIPKTANLTVTTAAETDLPVDKGVWPDFDASDAEAWGQSVQLDCTRGRSIGEEIVCIVGSTADKTAVSAQFALDLADAQKISYMQVLAYPGQQRRAADILGNLVAALGRAEDGPKARDWMLVHAEDKIPARKALFNALLKTDDNYGSGLLEVKIFPPVL